MRYRGRVLVVDDDADILALVSRVLENGQFQPLTVRTAAEARKLLKRKNKPDLIILDCGLPDADGMELCDEIRVQSGLSKTPILFLTARNTVDAKVIGFELGADDFLAKPFEPRELLARVEALMRRAKPGP